MPILNHNDLKKVEEYQNFVRTSPFANATQDLGWEKVKEGGQKKSEIRGNRL